MNAILSTLSQATLAARQRTGDARIAVAVDHGRFRITRVDYLASGASVIENVTEPLTFVAVLDALATLEN